MRALGGVVLGVLLTMCAALLELRRVSDGGEPSAVAVGVGVLGLVLSLGCGAALVPAGQRRPVLLAAALPFLLVAGLTAVLLAVR